MNNNHEHQPVATSHPKKSVDLHACPKVHSTSNKCNGGHYACLSNAYASVPVKQGNTYVCPNKMGPAVAESTDRRK